MSDGVRRGIEKDGAAGLNYLRQEAGFYLRKKAKGKGKGDLRQICKAVEIQRHIMHIRRLQPPVSFFFAQDRVLK